MARLFPCGLSKTTATALLGCLIVGGLGAMGAHGVVKRDPAKSVSVNRTAKGDRLPSVSIPNVDLNVPSSVTTFSRQREWPPLGCDPAFGSFADPAKSHIYKRCMV